MSMTMTSESRTVYMCMSVRGAINSLHRQRGNKSHFTDDKGRAMTKPQALDALMDELAKGHETIPLGPQCANPCPNADKGCPGFDYSANGGCGGFCTQAASNPATSGGAGGSNG